MWYMDADEEEDGGKGIEEEEDEDEDEDEFYEEETESEMEGGEGANGTMGGRNGDPHGDGLPHAYLENFMRAVDHGLSLLVHWSTKNWKLDAGDKAMDSEFGDSLKAGAQVFPLLKNVKKHLKRVKKGLKQLKRGVDENNQNVLTASLGQLRSTLLEARTQLLEKYSTQKVEMRLKEEGKDYESKRKELEKSRSYKRILRMALRFLLWWWKATLFCSMLFFTGACLLYWGRKTRFHGLVTRYYRGVHSLRRYLTSALWTRSYIRTTAASAADHPSSLRPDRGLGGLFDIEAQSQRPLTVGRLMDGGLAMGEKGMVGLADRVSAFISPRTIFMLFLRCLLLGLAFAFYQVVARVKREKREVLRFMRDVEQKLKAEREREAQKEKVESRREEMEELQKFPDELFMKIANRMWEVMMENVEKLITSCNELGTERILNELTAPVPGVTFVYNGITYSYNINARANFDIYFENCKNHIRGVISSYDNLLETINFRKQQEKLTKQCTRFDKANGALESDEWKPGGGGKAGGFLGDEDEEDGYGIVNKHELGDEDDEDDTFSIFGSGGGKQSKKGKGKNEGEEDGGEDDIYGRDDSDDDGDEENQRRRRRRGGRQDGANLRYGPSGEVLDDYYTYDYASDREFDADDEDDDGGGGDTYGQGAAGGSVYGDFEEMADIHSDYEHMD